MFNQKSYAKHNKATNRQLQMSSIECQTDFDFNVFANKPVPSFSEMESIGIFYFDANVSLSLSDDEVTTIKSNTNYDDQCVQFEYYKRASSHSNTRQKKQSKCRSSTTQTLLTISPNTHRSTQTSPTLHKTHASRSLVKNIFQPEEYKQAENDETPVHFQTEKFEKYKLDESHYYSSYTCKHSSNTDDLTTSDNEEFSSYAFNEAHRRATTFKSNDSLNVRDADSDHISVNYDENSVLGRDDEWKQNEDAKINQSSLFHDKTRISISHSSKVSKQGIFLNWVPETGQTRQVVETDTMRPENNEPSVIQNSGSKPGVLMQKPLINDLYPKQRFSYIPSCENESKRVGLSKSIKTKLKANDFEDLTVFADSQSNEPRKATRRPVQSNLPVKFDTYEEVNRTTTTTTQSLINVLTSETHVSSSSSSQNSNINAMESRGTNNNREIAKSTTQYNGYQVKTYLAPENEPGDNLETAVNGHQEMKQIKKNIRENKKIDDKNEKQSEDENLYENSSFVKKMKEEHQDEQEPMCDTDAVPLLPVNKIHNVNKIILSKNPTKNFELDLNMYENTEFIESTLKEEEKSVTAEKVPKYSDDIVDVPASQTCAPPNSMKTQPPEVKKRLHTLNKSDEQSLSNRFESVSTDEYKNMVKKNDNNIRQDVQHSKTTGEDNGSTMINWKKTDWPVMCNQSRTGKLSLTQTIKSNDDTADATCCTGSVFEVNRKRFEHGQHTPNKSGTDKCANGSRYGRKSISSSSMQSDEVLMTPINARLEVLGFTTYKAQVDDSREAGNKKTRPEPLASTKKADGQVGLKATSNHGDLGPMQPVKLFTDWNNILNLVNRENIYDSANTVHMEVEKVKGTHNDDTSYHDGIEADIDDYEENEYNNLMCSTFDSTYFNEPKQPAKCDMDKQKFKFKLEFNNKQDNESKNTSDSDNQDDDDDADAGKEFFKRTMNKDDQPKILISSVAPQSNKTNACHLSKHTQQCEIKANNSYENDSFIETSGYNPPSAPKYQRIAAHLPTDESHTHKAHHQAHVESTTSNRKSRESLMNTHESDQACFVKKVRHHSEADVSSIVTEPSIESSRLFENQSAENLVDHDHDHYSKANSKQTGIQKIMTSLAEREYQKAKKRIERRRARIPEIMELLKTAKSKEKKKLEDELRILLRKAEKDANMFKKFQIDDKENISLADNGTPSRKEKTKTIKSDIQLGPDPPKTKRSDSESVQRQAIKPSVVFEQSYNDAYSSAGDVSCRTIGIATRESGYSSCGDESGTETKYLGLRRRMNSMGGSDLRMTQSRDDIAYLPINEKPAEFNSKLQLDINTAVSKMKLDSCTIKRPSANMADHNSQSLLKMPSRDKPNSVNEAAHENRFDYNEKIISENPLRLQVTRQSSKVDDILTERVPFEALRPTIAIDCTNSTSSDSRLYSNAHTTPMGYNDPYGHYMDTTTYPNRNDIIRSDVLPNSVNAYVRSVPLSPGNSQAVSSAPRNTYPNSSNTTNGQPSGQQTIQQTQATMANSATNANSVISNSVNTNNGNNQPVSPYYQNNQEFLPNQLRIEYINENEIDRELMNSLNLQYDEQTGQTYFIDDLYEIKYVIIRDNSRLTEEKNEKAAVSSSNNLKVSYVEMKSLSTIGDTDVYQDPSTNEFYIQSNSDANRRWIVLADNWQQAPNTPYISENAIDLAQWDIYIEHHTQRKYIVDEDNGKRYYLIPSLDARLFTKEWSELDKKATKTANSTNPDVAPQKSDNEKNRGYQIQWPNAAQNTNLANVNADDKQAANAQEQTKDAKTFTVDYVDENELEDVDLDNILVFQDPTTGESYIQDPSSANHIWVILPHDWRESEYSTYVSDEDIALLKWDTFVEENTNRRYIVDDKTGNVYYIIPTMQDDPRNSFKHKWTLANQIVSKTQKADNNPNEKGRMTNTPSAGKNKPILKTSTNAYNKNHDDPRKMIKKPSEDELIKVLDYEPSRLEVKRPDDFRKRQDEPKLIIKRGKLADLLKARQVARPMCQRIKSIALSEVLCPSPRPLHHFLFEDQQKQKYSNQLDNDENGDSDLDESEMMTKNSLKWRSFTDLDDPTASKNQTFDKNGKLISVLDRNKLAEVQIHGYRKEQKNKRGIWSNSYKQTASEAWSPYSMPYSTPQVLRGVLTERFKEQNTWQRNHRSVVPKTQLRLKEQILATTNAHKQTWINTLNKSYKLKPRIILINDEEHILSADRSCKMYVQYMHAHDSVLGADPAYMLMLPNRGPVSPTRPLMVTPKQFNDASTDIALREAPVFVYHKDGNAYFENIAQYLAGNCPQLSPKTVRKILQFENIKEFEEYLESKITRDEAKRISYMSGESLINIQALKQDLLNSLSDTPQYYHMNCEYDPLRNDNLGPNLASNDDTKEVNIDGAVIKSTFVGFTPTGQVERLPREELPSSLLTAMKLAEDFDKSQHHRNAQSRPFNEANKFQPKTKRFNEYVQQN